MAGQCEQLLAIFRVPNTDAAIAISAGQQRAAGTESNRGDPIGVLLFLVQQLAGFGGVNLYQAARAAQGNLSLVRAHVGGQHAVIFLAQGHEPFARDHVPN